MDPDVPIETLAPMVLGILFILFVALPWLVLHYITKWKANSSLTTEDENLLDDLYELSRRLDERMVTIERIIAADTPGWSALGSERPAVPRLDKNDGDAPPLRRPVERAANRETM